MKNIIEERDANNITRKRFKKKFDDSINFSEGGGGFRLLDEGAVISGEDQIRFIIAKGTIEKYFNGENEFLPNIDEDYQGYINLGHEDFYANPLCLIGEWKKSDLTVVDIGNERKGLDVDVKLYDWHMFTEMLHKLPYSVGLSAEFYAHTDWDKTMLIGEYVIDEICITDFAVVGYGANASSNGINLGEKGEEMKKDELKQLQEALSEMDSPTKEEPVEPEEPKEVEELGETEEPEEKGEETEEPTEEEHEEAEEPEDEVDLSEVLSAIKGLNEKLNKLEKENSQLREKLEAKDNEIQTFSEKFKSLSVDLNPDFKGEKKEEMSADRYDGYSDGIGGW